MRTVLITDDSKTTQMLVQTTLQRLRDVQFRTAENGREAPVSYTHLTLPTILRV